MALTDEGAIAIASALLNDGVIPPFDANNAALGVGENGGAFSSAQTELLSEADSSGAGDSLRLEMDYGYPVREPTSAMGENTIRFRSTFTEDQANFQWLEYGVFNSAVEGGGTMLLRVVEDLGTKGSGAIWVFQVDVTVEA